MSCKRVVILGFFPYIATLLVQIYEEMKYLIAEFNLQMQQNSD